VITRRDHVIRIIDFRAIAGSSIVQRQNHDDGDKPDMPATSASSDPARPLAGIRVIDLGQYIAGPGAAMTLAELGANVIKVEPLAGDQARHIGRYGESMVRAYNRGKRSIALDLKHEAGREAALRLMSRADVVIQNLRPGVVDKLGLGPGEVRARFPRIVYLSISGFGSRGPSCERPGYDIAAQAESGLMSVTGEPDRPPQKVGVPIIDAAAAQLGAQAVLAALYGREKSGIGATLETSLLEVALHLQATTWADYLGGAPEPQRIGDGQPHNAPAAEVVPTRDGHIVLSAYAEEHWQRFCRVMGREELARDPRFASNAQRVAHREALRAVLRECLSQRSSEECVALLSGHQIVAGAVRSYAQVLHSPDLAASGLIVEAVGADGSPYRALTLPYRIDHAPRPSPPAAPACGADSDAVLAEAGYPPDEIAALRRDGVIV
jgi:crotonobetainyl-CoA:carnitine CoA-transferase CaiB-like acyl-CoA transferase